MLPDLFADEPLSLAARRAVTIILAMPLLDG